VRLKLYFLIVLLVGLVPTSLLASEDAFSILENLPAPEVKYEKAPVNSYPEIDFPSRQQIQKPVEPEPKPGKPIDPKQLIDKVAPPAMKSISRLVENLARPLEIKATDTSDTGEDEPLVDGSMGRRAPTGKFKIAAPNVNVYDNFVTLGKNQLIAEVEQSLQQNYDLFVNVVELSQKLEAEKAEKEAEKDVEEVEETEGKSYDAVFAKAEGLKKKEKWSDIESLFSDNPEAGDTQEGLEYQLEAKLNAKKPNYFHSKRIADQLIKKDKKHPLANYALALYYYNAKRPNPTKAASHLDIARNAKNPPAGASKLYWMTLLKKLWIVILILVAAIVGGIDYLRKKKKKQAALTEDISEANSEGEDNEEGKQPEEAEPASKSKLQEKLGPLLEKLNPVKEKLKPVLDKLAPLLAKLKKKKKEEQAEISADDDQVIDTEADGEELTEDSSEGEDEAESEEEAEETEYEEEGENEAESEEEVEEEAEESDSAEESEESEEEKDR
jgi:hypothetical protein